MEDTPKKIECFLKSVITQTCEKENKELLQCIKTKPKKDQAKKCYPEVVRSQRCFDAEMYNLLLVAKGMS